MSGLNGWGRFTKIAGSVAAGLTILGIVFAASRGIATTEDLNSLEKRHTQALEKLERKVDVILGMLLDKQTGKKKPAQYSAPAKKGE